MRSPIIFSFFTLAALAVGCTVEPSGDLSVDESAICCGSNCCLIEGTCFQRGEMNPANACEQCSPPTQTSWSAVPNCSTDAGTNPAPDASTPAADAGTNPAPDAGTTTEDDGGCVAVGPALVHPVPLALFALIISGFLVRRSRRASR